MPQDDIRYLLEQYMLGRLSREEEARLQEYATEKYEREMLHVFREMLEDGAPEAVAWEEPQLRALSEAILSVDRPKPVYKMRTMVWAVAASLLLLILGAAWFTYTRRPDYRALAGQSQEQRLENDVSPPSGSRSTLVLAGGKRINLDSVSAGTLMKQGNTDLLKSDSGRITYKEHDQASDRVLYNTLETSKGGHTSIVLADGTKVWLDAMSSLRFPTAFRGPDRRIELTGQAYFEVARDPSHPFVVDFKKAVVGVLGTSFNIKAYDDENTGIVTLVDGSVKISGNGAEALLEPGQQASVKAQGGIVTTDHADLEEALAWKNGYFILHGLDMASVLKQASRWYDVDIENLKTDNPRFFGEVPRNTPLSDLLKAMELSGKVKFAIEEKKIIVLP